MRKPPITRYFYLVAGVVSLVVGIIGIALPIVPTVPFLIFTAFCFARSNPAWEARIMNHPFYGPPIRNWREHGAISRRGKLAATGAFLASILFGGFTLGLPWVLLPPVIAMTALSWIWTRPEI